MTHEPLDGSALPQRRHGPKPMPAHPPAPLDLSRAIRERLTNQQAAAILERISRQKGFPVASSPSARPKLVLERFVREWLSDEETGAILAALNRRPLLTRPSRLL